MTVKKRMADELPIGKPDSLAKALLEMATEPGRNPFYDPPFDWAPWGEHCEWSFDDDLPPDDAA